MIIWRNNDNEIMIIVSNNDSEMIMMIMILM